VIQCGNILEVPVLMRGINPSPIRLNPPSFTVSIANRDQDSNSNSHGALSQHNPYRAPPPHRFFLHHLPQLASALGRELPGRYHPRTTFPTPIQFLPRLPTILYSFQSPPLSPCCLLVQPTPPSPRPLGHAQPPPLHPPSPPRPWFRIFPR
jgi:hypothetical protein